ncbi:N-acetylglucosamine-6-phosphate deacetylase [Planosporangium thailandense]|uniref:N-acetylglucosamine-6-phosphate deacetylase n=1 Tax=Planosporangium thailandense TaxID=765197 RepID=A0ABX0Y8M0_9ACTN|nr:N-acetylglucosamine-6-phosphate deacetylase [Planosporangium thailandense]NJC73614.1 N-acetylglucosamine-6-phosphate deacetylase [Planosporangium thailandense]
MTLLTGPRIVTAHGVIEHGHVRISGNTIAEVRPDRPDGDAEVVPGAWIVPGFVDIHTHGGGGHAFTTGDPQQVRDGAGFHLAHGTTTLLASLVTSPPEPMLAAVRAYAPLVAEGVIAGIHFEGPYLSRPRCGAQNPAHLRPPSIDELSRLLDAGGGAVRMVTIAPELPGALEAIRFLVARGVVAAIGHTDATYEQTLAGIAAGASVGTHVFNGMRPPHHREPGPVFALLAAESVTCELVADGVHLHDGTLSFATSVTGPARAALITDAMAAAGMPDGAYELGGQDVTVRDGVARLTDGDSIAGSTLTMDRALRRAVGAGATIVDAARMAATTPAAAIGRHDVGAVEGGRRADLVVLDDDLRVLRVMRAGTWLAPPS